MKFIKQLFGKLGKRGVEIVDPEVAFTVQGLRMHLKANKPVRIEYGMTVDELVETIRDAGGEVFIADGEGGK